MKIKVSIFLLVFMIASLLLTGCDSIFGGGSDTVKYNDKMESVSGKWQLLDDEDTYFLFDGTEKVMSFSYYEDGAKKFEGKFRAVCRTDADADIPLCYILTRSDKQKEDWINCYAENVAGEFTQFSILYGEEDLGVDGGTVYTHVYRISEMPYKVGTYVLEGEEYKEYSSDAFNDGEYRIPEGTYMIEGGQSLTVFPIMRRSYSLFSYTNGDTTVEGIFNIAEDRKTIYLYIEHDIYEKVRDADKDNYDTTFSLNYPPDFYLNGDFDTSSNTLVINGLYHHGYSPTEIEDSFWVFGTYEKQ